MREVLTCAISAEQAIMIAGSKSMAFPSL